MDSPRLLSVLRPRVCSGAGWGEAEKVGHCPSLWHLPHEQKYLQWWPDSNEFEQWGFWSYLSEFPQTKPFPENCSQHSRLSHPHWASRYGISLPSCPRSSVERRGPAVKHRELEPRFCGHPCGRRIRKRLGVCACVTGSLRRTADMSTPCKSTLLQKY